jgi:hypothetical protein
LFKLDMINNTLPQSQFAVILKDKKALNLTNQQIDSLLSSAFKLERLKAAYNARFPYQKYDAYPFEGKSLLKILNEAQYNSYLATKNRTNAIVTQKKMWGKLKQYGLNKGVDSAQVNTELITYNLNLLVANEKYHTDDSPKNAEVKNKLDRNKPVILQKLDYSIKTTALNSTTNKSLSW